MLKIHDGYLRDTNVARVIYDDFTIVPDETRRRKNGEKSSVIR